MCSLVVAQKYQPAKLFSPLDQRNGRTGVTCSKRMPQQEAKDR